MTNTNSSVSTTGISASTAANLLSSLNAGLGSDGPLSKLFDSLLEDAKTTAVPQQSGGVTASAAATSNVTATTDSNDSADATSAMNLGDIMAALRKFVATRKDRDQNGAASNKQQQASTATSTTATTNTTTATSDANASTMTANAAGSSKTSTASSSTRPGQNPSTANDPNAPPSLADLLAQLQAILQMLQKQIQTAQGSLGVTTTTADATNTGSNQAAQDLLAAGGALGDLLALAQMLEKKLQLNPTGAGSTASGGTDTDLATLDLQMRANLKTLMDNLKMAANTAVNGTAGTDADNAVADSASATSSLTSSLASSLATSATAASVATPDDIIKGALAAANDFLKQLDNVAGNTNIAVAVAAVAAVAADAMAPTGGSNGSSLDADSSNGSNAATTSTAATVTADTANTAVDTSKTASPYSFASQLSAERAQNGGTVGLPTAVEQVLLMMNKGAKDGSDQMTIQLHPADLGSINVKLDFAKDGTVTGQVVANNADTLSMLQKDSRSLERALQEAGLRADPGSLQFSLGGQSSNNSNQTAQDQAAGKASGAPTFGNAAVIANSDNGISTTTSWVISPGRVNIQV